MEIKDLPRDKTIILFDGVCNLCDNLVNKIIKFDKHDNFRFVSLQSPLGIEIVKHIGISSVTIDSIIVYQVGKAYYYKSQAVFEIAKTIGGKFYFLKWLSYLPLFITNFLYDYVAKNRYKWYGKKDSCMIPSKEILNKFID